MAQNPGDFLAILTPLIGDLKKNLLATLDTMVKIKLFIICFSCKLYLSLINIFPQ